MKHRFLAATLSFALAQTFAVAPAAGAGGATAPANRIWMTVGERRFAVTLADTEAARAFAARLPLTLDMPDLNGNEKHVKLATPLPANPSLPGTIRNGDLMLWGAETVVVFYLTFESTYSYTRLGRIEAAADLPRVLGPGKVRVTFTKATGAR